MPEDLAKNGRLFGGFFVLAGGCLAAFEYHSIRSLGVFGIESVLWGTFSAVIGTAALIEPGLLWSLSSRRKELPRGVRVAGLLLAPLVVGIALGLVRYLKRGHLG